MATTSESGQSQKARFLNGLPDGADLQDKIDYMEHILERWEKEGTKGPYLSAELWEQFESYSEEDFKETPEGLRGQLRRYLMENGVTVRMGRGLRVHKALFEAVHNQPLPDDNPPKTSPEITPPPPTTGPLANTPANAPSASTTQMPQPPRAEPNAPSFQAPSFLRPDPASAGMPQQRASPLPPPVRVRVRSWTRVHTLCTLRLR